jgi:predicted acetyltransferase
MQIELLPAAAGDRTTLANLMQLYLHDLMDFGGPPPDDQGAFSYPALDAYWSDPDCSPFLIRADGRAAGFALTRRASRIHTPFDGHAIQEFFVLRGCRRQGVGAAAAMQLFDRLPGRWEVSTAAVNIPATAFWRSVSQRYTCGAYEEVFVTRDGWRGVIESFVAPPPCRSSQ